MNNEIVASAAASFNNAALAMPNFLWAAVLSLPIFWAVLKMTPEIFANFFSSKKNRNYNFAWLVEASIIVWMIFDFGNWAVMRDNVGFLPYVIAVTQFLLCRDFVARLRDQNPKLPMWWREIGRQTRKWMKINSLLIFIFVLSLGAVQSWNFTALQITSVLFGASAGYLGRRPAHPVKLLTAVILLLTVGIAMQPEYFRFGQLGHLSLVHLIALVAMMELGAAVFAFTFFRPSNFIKDNHYKYVKWFMWLTNFAALILFIMTESVPVMLGLFIGILVTFALAVKHLDKVMNVAYLADNFWAIMLCLFGIITAMPVITVVGLLWWKNNNTKNFIKNVRKVLL